MKKPKYFYNIIQRSEEWRKIRAEKFTATDASDLIGRDNTLKKLCIEKALGIKSDIFINKDMQRGIDDEDKALALYEFISNKKIKRCGFVQLGNHLGYSPDGLIGKDGCVEVKSHKDKIFINLILDSEIEKKYYNQIQFGLYVSKRKYTDYIAYNDKIPPYIYAIRIKPDEILHENFELKIKEAIIFKKIYKKKYKELLKRKVGKNGAI